MQGPGLGWLTFGGDYNDDGVSEALEVVEDLVLRGGTVHSTRRSSELLDSDGRQRVIRGAVGAKIDGKSKDEVEKSALTGFGRGAYNGAVSGASRGLQDGIIGLKSLFG